MKNRRILCMTALMLAMLLAMGGCKQAETKEANAHVEQTTVLQPDTILDTPSTQESILYTMGVAAKKSAVISLNKDKFKTDKEASDKTSGKTPSVSTKKPEKKTEQKKESTQPAEKIDYSDIIPGYDKYLKKLAEYEAALQKINEDKNMTQGDKLFAREALGPEPVPPVTYTVQPHKKWMPGGKETYEKNKTKGYALSEYGNPSNDIIVAGLVDTINPSDPQLNAIIGSPRGVDYRGSTPIPNPFAKVDPISPFRGMKNPPADWPKPQPMGKGEYKWNSETGCWRYYNDLGNASKYYLSLYGGKTVRTSERKQQIAAGLSDYSYDQLSASTRGVY